MLAGSNTHRLGMFASLVFIASTRRSAMHPYGLSLVSNKHSNSAFVIALRSVQPCSQTSHVHMGSQPLSQFLSGLALTGLLAAASAGLLYRRLESQRSKNNSHLPLKLTFANFRSRRPVSFFLFFSHPPPSVSPHHRFLTITLLTHGRTKFNR